MEEILQSALQEGETILWRSRPGAFETLDKTNKADFIKKACIGGIIAVLFAVSLLVLGGFERKSWILIGVVTLLCAIPVINVLGDASKLRKTEYIATSDRLITMREEVRGMEYEKIHTGIFATDADGHVSLLCGKEAVNAKPSKWREMCVVIRGALDDSGECERFCFYASEDADGLKKVLHEKMPALF